MLVISKTDIDIVVYYKYVIILTFYAGSRYNRYRKPCTLLQSVIVSTFMLVLCTTDINNLIIFTILLLFHLLWWVDYNCHNKSS